jgi:hypothetical protein
MNPPLNKMEKDIFQNQLMSAKKTENYHYGRFKKLSRNSERYKFHEKMYKLFRDFGIKLQEILDEVNK